MAKATHRIKSGIPHNKVPRMPTKASPFSECPIIEDDGVHASTENSSIEDLLKEKGEGTW